MTRGTQPRNRISGFILSGIATCLAPDCNAESIYHRKHQNTLAGFQQFLEGPLATQNRSTLQLTSEGIQSTPSQHGGFTLFKFKELSTDSFNLRAVFQIPPGIRYSNSGIYLLYWDPTVPIQGELNSRDRAAYDLAIQRAKQRAQMYGAGPYEADSFARELQIIAGFEPNLPADNHGAGAFYGVQPVVQGREVEGTQGLSPYELVVGDTYELTMEAHGQRIKTYLRSIRHQDQRVLVSSFVNVSRNVDPIRGGAPIALLLQSFPNNGDDVKGPIFHEIAVDELN